MCHEIPSAKLLCKVLGWNSCNVGRSTVGVAHKRENDRKYKTNARSVLANDTVYFRPVHQNRQSLQLYEYAKGLCLAQMKKAGLPLPHTAHGLHDYTADIKEAAVRFKRAGWPEMCWDGARLHACGEGGGAR